MNKLPRRLLCIALVLVGGSVSRQPEATAKNIELPPETAKLKPANLPGYQIAAAKCGICHSADYISFQPPGMTQAQWTAEMKKMQHAYGAPLDDDEVKLLGIYLAVTYGDASSVSPEDKATAAHSQESAAAP
jgi:cytochrome c